MQKQVGGTHYSKLPIQPVESIVKNGIPYREGTAIKYIVRHQDKNRAEDIRKAIHFLEMILEDYTNEELIDRGYDDNGDVIYNSGNG